MTRRSIDVVAALPHGPQDPLVATPERRPGSVRRTTNIDQRRQASGQPMLVEAKGRDLRTSLDGTTTVVDEAAFTAQVDASGTLLAIESDPPEPGLAALVGGHVSPGFRARVDAAVPHHRDA